MKTLKFKEFLIYLPKVRVNGKAGLKLHPLTLHLYLIYWTIIL